MNFIDKVDPKGYVVIKDGNGKLIHANFNTIVNEGRRTIIAKLLQNLFNTETNIGDGIGLEDGKYDFYAICLGNSTGETSLSTVFTDNENSEYKDKIDGDKQNPFWFNFPSTFKPNTAAMDHGINEYQIYYDQNANRYYLSITLHVIPGSQLDTDKMHEICSLAIIMKHKNYSAEDNKFYKLNSDGQFDKDQEITDITSKRYRLFSRFRFDAIPMTSESEFIMTYYIYF